MPLFGGNLLSIRPHRIFAFRFNHWAAIAWTNAAIDEPSNKAFAYLNLGGQVVKKLASLSVVSCALILAAASTSNAQGVAGTAARVVLKVFESKPLNEGERDYEKQPPTKEEREQFAREQKELREQREQRESPSRRESDSSCTRGGRRDN